MTNDSFVTPAQRDLVITRIFEAPRELVFKAWSEPEHLKQWWGPQFFTAPECQTDFRVGGSYLFCMRGPDNRDYWSAGIYREIVVPERIVYSDNFADEQGNPVPASYYGLGGDELVEMLVTLIFEEAEGKTKLTLRHQGLPTANQMLELTGQGWNESLDKLAASLG